MGAHPLFVAEQAFRIFLDQWTIGLKPQLTLKTDDIGAISICSEVTSSVPIASLQTKRSGACSRQRRRATRLKAHSDTVEQAVAAIGSNDISAQEVQDLISEPIALNTKKISTIKTLPEASSTVVSTPISEEVEDHSQTNAYIMPTSEDQFVTDCKKSTSINEAKPNRRDAVKMIICETCDLGFHSQEDFEDHNAFRFCCSICGICFPSEEAVHLHEDEFHPGIYSTNIARKMNAKVS